ncbi:hypothetical protein [Tenacibaculum ovolyticum]|uniref:hypothetical protein n=1 Tax=Tenacibaculum ovolyticum TaxID=104270 RepID=UPI00048D690B|nr:hypothetical protein [Tenacibaculum ovolyticum]
MKRRIFIQNTILGVTGLSISSLTLACSKKEVILNEIIGRSEEELISFNKEGNSDFSYYTIPYAAFSHPLVSGRETFIFCKESSIVGYTVKKENTDDVEAIFEKLNELYGDSKLIYENDFGYKYEWSTESRLYALTYTKAYPNLPQNSFYSEAVLKNELIVF